MRGKAVRTRNTYCHRWNTLFPLSHRVVWKTEVQNEGWVPAKSGAAAVTQRRRRITKTARVTKVDPGSIFFGRCSWQPIASLDDQTPWAQLVTWLDVPQWVLVTAPMHNCCATLLGFETAPDLVWMQIDTLASSGRAPRCLWRAVDQFWLKEKH